MYFGSEERKYRVHIHTHTHAEDVRIARNVFIERKKHISIHSGMKTNTNKAFVRVPRREKQGKNKRKIDGAKEMEEDVKQGF